jgi:hypothetical protein
MPIAVRCSSSALEDVAQGLAAVAVGREVRGRHHELVALAHQRDFPGAAVVGAGGVEAEESVFAHGAAVVVEHQHADVVHVARAVHGGAGVGLGQDQGVQALARGQVAGGQAFDRARLHQVVLAAQHAQAAALHRAELAVGDLVLAVAQEGEVVVGGPAQEGLRLGAAGGVDRQRAGLEFVGDVHHLVAHRLPVGDGLAHVRQRGQQRLLDRLHGFGVGLAVDLQVHHRFGQALADVLQLAGGIAGDREHRVGDLVQRGAELRQRHAHRVDQEGHVVVDDAHHGVGAVEAVGGEAGVEHRQLGRAGLALAAEAQEGLRHPGPVAGRATRQFVFRKPGEEAAGEALEQGVLGGGQAGRQGRDDGVEGVGGSQGVGIH